MRISSSRNALKLMSMEKFLTKRTKTHLMILVFTTEKKIALEPQGPRFSRGWWFVENFLKLLSILIPLCILTGLSVELVTWLARKQVVLLFLNRLMKHIV